MVVVICLTIYTQSALAASCAAGYYSSTGADTSGCIVCSAGFYSTFVSSTTCMSCPAGSYCATSGLTVVTGSCSAGTYSTLSQSNCISCTAGYYSETTGATDSSTCNSTCAAGFYSAAGASSCTSCSAGYYSSASSQSGCTACLAGYYSSSTGSSSRACASCSKGYFSTTGASSCDATLHDFDFRGCTTGMAVTDDFLFTATPVNGPTCSSYGMYFDGFDDYLVLTNWEWGGATSFEVLVKYQSFIYWSRVFDFGNGPDSDNVVLANFETTSTSSFDGKCLFVCKFLIVFYLNRHPFTCIASICRCFWFRT